MKAVTWQGKHDMQVKEVPDPKILDARDIILRVTTTAICGSDLHLYDGYMPTMEKGDVIGHEFMGVVEEAGHNHPLKRGDRVLIPFQIACGTCHFCQRMETALCDNSNPEGAEKMRTAYGQAQEHCRERSRGLLQAEKRCGSRTVLRVRSPTRRQSAQARCHNFRPP